MTTHYKTRAFILAKKDVNEADRVFSVFTYDFGRLDIFAKAIRKATSKLRSGIDIFCMSEIEFIQGKNRKTLTDATVIEKFSKVSGDLEKFKTANRIGEVLNNFIKGEEKDKDIFDLLNNSFGILDGGELSSKKCAIIYYYFLWSTLSLLGYCPEVQECNMCREKLMPNDIYFSYKLGGVICKRCLSHDASAVEINSDIVKILRLIFKKEWEVVSRLKIDSESRKLFEKISDNYYPYILSSGIINKI